MNSIDLIRMGLNNLFRRKTRTFLTVLGVIIGTASIVIMLSLGFGMKYTFEEQVASMGSVTTIEVYPSYEGGRMVMRGGGGSGRQAGSDELDEEAIAKFGRLAGVVAVSPEIETYVRIVSGKYAADIQLRGVNPETMEAFSLQVEEGRLLQEGDGDSMVFGSEIPYNFINPKDRDPWKNMSFSGEGKPPKVSVLKDKLSLTFDTNYGARTSPLEQANSNKKPVLYKMKGVGILKSGQMENDYYAYMDITELKKLIQANARSQEESNSGSRQTLAEQLKYQRVRVKVADINQVTPVQNAIKEMGFQTSSLNDVLESTQKTASTIQLILGGIGAISLLVAALGITNTMMMSIYERTREIGIMKVIGASLQDIRRLFLFESGIIGFMGGLLGMAVSFLLSLGLNAISRHAEFLMNISGGGGKISVIPAWLVLAVLALSTLVGLISGYSPARRAMKLSALEAIRND